MLQIIIVHEPNRTHISQITDLDSLEALATYDDKKKSIDLSVLTEHIGADILVTHFNRNTYGHDCTMLDYEQIKILTNVGVDENGFTFIEYA